MPKPDQKAVEALYVELLAKVGRGPLAHATADRLLLDAVRVLGHRDLALAYECVENRSGTKFICA